MKNVMKQIGKLVRNEEGQGLVEYVLVISLVALFVIVALKFLGGTLGNTYNNIGIKMPK